MIVVVIGFWPQSRNDKCIKYIAVENPAQTTNIQNNLVNFLPVEMGWSPWMVDNSKNCLNSFMVGGLGSNAH